MQLLDALCLLEQLLRGGDNDDHVGKGVGMTVLVGNVVDILRRGKGGIVDVGCRQRFLPCHRDIVESHRTTRCNLNLDGVDRSDVVNPYRSAPTLSAVIFAEARDAHVGHALAIVYHPDKRVGACRHLNGQLGCRRASRVLKQYLLGLSHLELLCIEEVASTCHPGVAVYLVERMIIRRRGIERCQKLVAVDGQRRFF